MDRKLLRHPRGAGADEAAGRWWLCAEVQVIGIADPILSEHQPLFSVGAMAEQRSVEPAAAEARHHG